MIGELVAVVTPVFGLALVGWLFAGWRKVDLTTLADLTLYLAAPALVFSGLAGRSVDIRSMLVIGSGVVVQSIVCGLVALLAFKAIGVSGRGLYLAVMFPNTGNLGLPLALFAFGPEGLAVAVVVFVSVTLAHYSIGLAVISGSIDPRKMLRMPLFTAALAGIIAAVVGWEPPLAIARGIELLGEACVPLMLLSLGIRMRTVRLSRPGLAILAVALRMVPGLLTGLLWVHLFGLEGPERGVVLVTGVLPSAVMNFVIADAYGQQVEEVASTILLSTLLSMLSIPLVLSLLV